MTPADALPYADRWVSKHYASQAASRKHARDMKALEAKAGERQ